MTTVSTSDATFRLQEGETLLEGLERTGHDVEYQCRSGYCGTCRLKLEAGKVSYTTAPLAFVAPGEGAALLLPARRPRRRRVLAAAG